jgi:hypothetical protein
MAVVALDTYEVVKALREAGFNEAQAAALTDAVRRAQQIDLSELATKDDLRREIAELKADFYNKLLTVFGLQIVVILGGVAGLLRLLQP